MKIIREYDNAYLEFSLWLIAATRIDEANYTEWVYTNRHRLLDAFPFSGEDANDIHAVSAWCLIEYTRALGLAS